MAENQVDVRRILSASYLTIGIGIVLAIISVIFQLLSVVLTEGVGDIVDVINGLYLLILYPVFLGLFFWTGMRAVRNFRFDLIGAGYITAFSLWRGCSTYCWPYCWSKALSMPWASAPPRW